RHAQSEVRMGGRCWPLRRAHQREANGARGVIESRWWGAGKDKVRQPPQAQDANTEGESPVEAQTERERARRRKSAGQKRSRKRGPIKELPMPAANDLPAAYRPCLIV